MYILKVLTPLFFCTAVAFAAPLPMKMKVADTAPGAALQPKLNSLNNSNSLQEANPSVLWKRKVPVKPKAPAAPASKPNVKPPSKAPAKPNTNSKNPPMTRSKPKVEVPVNNPSKPLPRLPYRDPLRINKLNSIFGPLKDLGKNRSPVYRKPPSTRLHNLPQRVIGNPKLNQFIDNFQSKVKQRVNELLNRNRISKELGVAMKFHAAGVAQGQRLKGIQPK